MTVRLRPDLDALPVYIPGKALAGALKLASNEVNFGPLPSVATEIAKAISTVNRYPDNDQVRLTDELAKKHGVSPNEIQVGCGSVALCQNLVTITCSPGDEVLFGWRSFDTYPLAAMLAGAKPIQIPLEEGLTYDLPAMVRSITNRTRLIFICNPNNPTGTVVLREELLAFLREVPSDVVIALDEAYFEYMRLDSECEYDALELRKEFSNLVVLRTFSKAYGLAGLRVGYAIGDPTIITALSKANLPFSVNSLAQIAAVACLRADEELLARTDLVVAERARVTDELRTLGFQTTLSQTNFVWINLGADALRFAEGSCESGVIIRPFDGDGVRVTITEPAEDNVFLAYAAEWARTQM